MWLPYNVDFSNWHFTEKQIIDFSNWNFAKSALDPNLARYKFCNWQLLGSGSNADFAKFNDTNHNPHYGNVSYFNDCLLNITYFLEIILFALVLFLVKPHSMKQMPEKKVITIYGSTMKKFETLGYM